ncbi:TIGR03619 family F420-dependent LLM class oxidoreductase [Microlunatus flavus]|uniref:Probable F420-dependent oxidoreductase, Rv2161c family n=1 Tax=Microlunatus flavus TaxID=1036181 RepID=A0A1H9MJV6_9ACTN|nr:TIGR03619 family F420-dependent LLM class oxidoreductase [Microlunatus flavus]SER24004.1 probable F420-dependent oxidoreductase, Rv2161c family [Microlunatus flavus]
MDLGFALPTFGRHATRTDTVTLATAAEELGYDSLWVSEHLVVPADLFDPFGQTFDALTTLAHVAAVTERVRLGTSVLILPLHDPVLLAKQAATLHVLSGRRFRLGVGVGWLEEEFGVVGADFAGRAAVMEHHLGVLTYLLGGGSGSDREPPDGFPPVPFAPAVETPLPLLLGGHAPAALRRAARWGDGWHGVWLEPDEVPRHVAATRGASGRPNFSVSLRVELLIDDGGTAEHAGRGLIGPEAMITDKLERYAAAGVDELVVDFMDQDHGGVPDLPVMLEQLGRLRALVPTSASA